MNLAMPAATTAGKKKRPGARKHNRAFQTSKAIMQLIHQSSNLTMSSREIAELTGKQHKDVIRDIRVMLDALQKDGADLRHVREEKDARGYTAMFHLDRELTYTLLTGYSIPLRRNVVARWHELEAQQGPKLPTTMAEALRLAADQAEQIEKQQAALAIAAPKAAFVDQYVDASTLMGFRQVAKLLKANENHFRLFLIEKKVMYRLAGEWVAYQNHIDAGRFSVKTGEANGHAFNRSMFTPKGVEWVAGEFAKFQLAQNEEVPA